MERLTIDEIIEHCDRNSKNYEHNVPLDVLSNQPLTNTTRLYWEHKQVSEYLKELKQYRGLEEQGRLLKLPCDKVYYIVDKNNPRFATVMSKSIRDLTVYEIEKIDIDGRYFSTEEKAEAKLKELRGEE